MTTMNVRRQAALKAWETRRAKANGTEGTVSPGRKAALKAWETRRAKQGQPVSLADRLSALEQRVAKLEGSS